MAATGKTPILLYGSTTATNTPSAGNLTNSSDGCEIAINVADKNLFFKDATNTVNTVPIRQSSASSDGWLSSTDWSTFNSKQPAGTYVTSVTGTAPVVSSGGTTPAISMAAATGSVNGYLTSTDWTTFNNKAPAFTYTSQYIPYGQGTTTPTQSASLKFDGTNLITANNVLINTASSGGAFNNSLTINSGANALAGVQLVNNTTGIAYNTGVQLNVNGANGYLSSFNGPLYVQTNGYNIRATFDTSGNVTINNGNLIVGTSGKGIDFSATAGTGTSELLADYEEGTFTPVVFGTTTAGTGTYSSQLGTYTKIGRQVTIQIYLWWTAHTGTGNMQVSGLPYTSNASISAPLSTMAYNLTTSANTLLSSRVLVSNTVIELVQLPTGGGAWGGVAMDTNVDALLITGTYFV